MSYANMDGVPTQTAGTSEILASDWNTYVRDNFDSIKFGHIVCTSSTRPTGIAEGTMIYETDTQKVLVYNGSAWVEVSDLDSADGLSASGQTKLNKTDNIGLVHLNTTTFSSASTINVDSVFSTTYNSYHIVGEWSSSGIIDINLRLRSSGSTNTTSNYQMAGNRVYRNVSTPAGADLQYNGETRFLTSGLSVASPWRMVLDFFNPASASLNTTGNACISGEFYGVTYMDWAYRFAANTSFDGFSLATVSGTITGNVSTYGRLL